MSRRNAPTRRNRLARTLRPGLEVMEQRIMLSLAEAKAHVPVDADAPTIDPPATRAGHAVLPIAAARHHHVAAPSFENSVHLASPAATPHAKRAGIGDWLSLSGGHAASRSHAAHGAGHRHSHGHHAGGEHTRPGHRRAITPVLVPPPAATVSPPSRASSSSSGGSSSGDSTPIHSDAFSVTGGGPFSTTEYGS
ncbi:MAG TPA: hypothetical protein VKW77_06845, partial [Acidimicrobiales bacterium]|nr:hypothetical protein [Acidimicrobiales bacterium]